MLFIVQPNLHVLFPSRLVVRKCKAMGPSPTIDVSEDAQTFIAPFGVVFCKVVKGRLSDITILDIHYHFRSLAAASQ